MRLATGDRSKAGLSVQARLKELPWVWDMVVRAGTRTGLSPQNLLLLETLSRPWWLYRSRGRLVAKDVVRRSPAPVSRADLELCKRLIAAFELAVSEPGTGWKARGVWAHLLDMHYGRLAGALQRQDASDLAVQLASMFQQEITGGMMMHAHAVNASSWLGSRVIAIKSLDVLVSLGEAIGAIPVDGPEQRRGGLVFDGNVAELVARIEHELGIRVRSPDVGAPFGLVVDGRVITLETPEQIYAALRLAQGMDEHLESSSREHPKVVEIGGGYGAMCHWYLLMKPAVARYTIIDLPIVNVLQGYFLSKALGVDAVSFGGEARAKVQILPSSALAEVEAPFDVLVNKDSMPEMPYDVMLDYLQWARANCDGLFYSYNQEMGTEFLGEAEGRVPEALAQLGGFHRVRRDHSWLRRGYVEEIYTLA